MRAICCTFICALCGFMAPCLPICLPICCSIPCLPLPLPGPMIIMRILMYSPECNPRYLASTSHKASLSDPQAKMRPAILSVLGNQEGMQV